MKRNIRFLALMMAILMMLTCFAGCKKGTEATDSEGSESEVMPTASDVTSSDDTVSGKNSGESKTESGSKATSGTASGSSGSSAKPVSGKTATGWDAIKASMPKELRGKQIEIFHWNPSSELPGAAKMLSNFKKQTGINVKWTVASYDNYDVELQARITAGKSPDIVLFQWMNASRMNLCQPIANSGYDFTTSEWDTAVANYYSVNGKTYAVNMKDTLLNRPEAIFYNRSNIEKYGFEDPYTLWKNGKWTEDKFMEMCKAFKTKTSKPAWVVSKYDIWTLISGLQGEISYSNGKYSNGLTDKRAVAAWQKCADLYHEGLIDRTWDIDGFCNGTYLFMDSSLMFARSTQPYFAKLKSEGTIGFVPFFTLKGQTAYYQSMNEYEAYGIAKGAKNALAAAYFLRYYLDPETYDEKEFFCTAEALEVYQYCMKQPNRIMHNRCPLGSGNSTSPAAEVQLALEGATAAQVPSILSKYTNKIDSVVADLNNRLKKIK